MKKDSLKKDLGNLAQKAGYIAISAGLTAGEKAKDVAGTIADKAKKIQKPEIDIKKSLEKVSKGKSAEKTEAKLPEKTSSLDEQLQEAINTYNAEYGIFNDNGANILRQRERAVDLLDNVESLVNSIANHPKSFDADISEVQLHKKEFRDVCEFAKQELDAAKKSAAGVGAGVAGGMAVASLAPSVAMWVATTFGTASTGTAISALSGAAATNAALAWLGGGALAAGGQGMAAGSAFLAMTGPVGWGIGGATLLASIVLFANKKVKLNKDKKEEIEAVKKNIESVQEINAKLHSLLDKTIKLREALNAQYGTCMSSYGKNFMIISEDGQLQLGTLVNNAKSLAMTLGETLGE